MAEEYKDDPKTAGTKTERTTVVTREGAENGAREYPIPTKRAFPWWLLLPLLLIPLLLLISRSRTGSGSTTDSTSGSTPAAAASPASAESPAVVAAASPEAEATSASGGAAIPPPGPKGATGATGLAGKDIKVFKGNDITVSPKEGASAKGEPLTDVFAITGAKDRTVLVGRKVQLKNVDVIRVLNDQAFYVGKGSDAEMLVLLDPRLDAGTSGGEKVVIAQGKTVSLTGLLEGAPTSEQLTKYKVSAEDAAAIGQGGAQSVYLHATIAQDKSEQKNP